jgi:hypothetical protein
MARQLFVEVIVENRTAVVPLPRPDVRPFFETLSCQVPDEMMRWRKRRGSLTRDRRRQTAACALPLSRTTPTLKASFWGCWAVRLSGQRAAHCKGALA